MERCKAKRRRGSEGEQGDMNKKREGRNIELQGGRHSTNCVSKVRMRGAMLRDNKKSKGQ